MNRSIFRQLFLSYGAIFIFLLVSLFGISYLELSLYLNDRAAKEILLSTSVKREQLESEIKQQFINLKSWVNLDVMNDVITLDADLRITRTLESFKAQYQLPGNLYALSISGELIASDQKISLTPDFSLWLSAIKGNQPLIDKHIDPVSQQPVIALWQPVHASFNTTLVIGYLVMTYPWAAIDSLQTFSDSQTHLLLFNQSGQVIIEDKHLSDIPTQDELQHAMPISWATSLLGKLFLKAEQAQKTTNNELIVGDTVFFVNELKNTDKTPYTNLWHWFSLADKKQFYAPMYNILKISFLIGIITLLLTLLLIFYISRKISRPIQILTDAAVNIALTLDLSKRVPIHGKNELSRLAIAFNDMSIKLGKVWQEKNQATQALQSMNQELEEKVAERTEHLAWQATHDPLTGLPNRALLSERLTQAILQAQRDNIILAVLFIDLDGFKAVNDSFGHDKGDFLLVELAKRFQAIIRQPDTIARLGGDEFVILMQIQTAGDLDSPLKRIVDLINKPFVSDSDQLKVSPSIGVTLYPDDLSDADGLIRHADQAMYDAKKKGRNQIQFFNVETDYQIHSDHKLREQIKQALVEQQLVLHFQPQINLLTGDIVGAEALIRWQCPEQGLVFPDDFLPVIEHTDLIIDVGRWVIQQACRQLKNWNALGFNLKLSVNIACRHIQHPDFFDEIKAILTHFPEVQAEQLILEITESSAMKDISQAKMTLQRCLDHQVRIALDDFGTGYSSLTYLRQLPVSFLKIDKSFIIDMLKDREDKAIVEGIISLAEIFKQNVVAEGIETQAHLNELKAMHCTFGQGYFISRPLTEEGFIAWLTTRSK